MARIFNYYKNDLIAQTVIPLLTLFVISVDKVTRYPRFIGFVPVFKDSVTTTNEGTIQYTKDWNAVVRFFIL